MPTFSLRLSANNIYTIGCWLWVIALSGFMSAAHSAEGPAPDSLVAKTLPDWVRDPLEVDPQASRMNVAGVTASTPTRMHFVESQTDVVRAANFRHYAYRIETEAGLQQAGQVSVDFAPGYQSLLLHSLRIWRDGKARDVLDASSIQVLRQEENAERFLYHGRMTALMLLRDVRVGDIVEFSYTITGQNPVFDGRFSTQLVCSSSAPMDRLYYRIKGAPGRSLQIATLGNSQTVYRKTAADDGDEHIWTADKVPAVSALNDVPPNECQYAYIQITEYTDWKDVRHWARGLFSAASQPTPELMAQVEPLLANCKTIEEKADVLLRFVQDDVRYLGIHLNESTHRPTAPQDVIEQRFGDCKDKSLLLVALLRGIGLEADVALVNSAWRNGLINLQPSPLSFDHAIVRVRQSAARQYGIAPAHNPYAPAQATSGFFNSSLFLSDSASGQPSERPVIQVRNSDTYLWIDPTATLQGGDFEHRYVPAYGYGLVLNDSKDDLVAVNAPHRTESAIDVRENYTISDYTSPVNLVVNTTYRGGSADDYRYFRRVVDPTRYTQQMTGFFARFYPKIKALGEITWTDDRARNELTSRMEFEVEEFWTNDASAKYRFIEFYPWEFSDRLPRPETIDRKFSFALPHPISFSQHTSIFLPKDWPLSTDAADISDDTFAFKWSAQGSGRRVDLQYDWRTLSDSVPPHRMTDWNKKMGDVRATFGYKLQQNIRLAEAIQNEAVVWSIITSSVTGIIAGISLGVWLYHWQPPRRPRPENSRHLVGIGGWLILLAFGVVLRPMIQLVGTKDLFNLTGNYPAWIAMTDPESAGYMSGYATLIWAEAFIQCLFFSWSVVMIFQFFKRRPSFPHSLTALFVLAAIWVVIDELALAHVFKTEAFKSKFSLLKQIIPSAIWIWYLQVSRRVKVTFRRQSSPPPLGA
jgi:hypothetical protein